MSIEPTAPNGVLVTTTGSVRGYSSAAVDEYLAAAEVERERLMTALAEAKERQAKARASIGLHRVMLSMLLEAQEELQARRAEADAEAAAVLQATEAEAEVILRAGHEDAARMRPAQVTTVRAGAEAGVVGSVDPRVIDLPREHLRDVSYEGDGAHPGPTNGTKANGATPPLQPMPTMQPVFAAAASSEGSADEYFRYLRGALQDEQPLGPRHD